MGELAVRAEAVSEEFLGIGDLGRRRAEEAGGEKDEESGSNAHDGQE